MTVFRKDSLSPLASAVVRGGWLLLVAAAVFLLWIGANRPLSSVVVEGVLSTEERAAVQTALTPNLQTRLLSLDLAEVVAQVEALSWPQAVSVRRVWPDELVVGVVKQQVVAAWNDDRYLTSTGQIVTLAVAPGPLPKLRSVTTEPGDALELYQRLAALSKQQGSALVALNENAVGEWRITLRPALAVMLGEAETTNELVDRLHRFFVVRQRRPDSAERQLRYADARYANGVALRWNDATDETQPLVATGP